MKIVEMIKKIYSENSDKKKIKVGLEESTAPNANNMAL